MMCSWQKHALLRSMLAEGFEVLEFQGKVESLEDAFMAATGRALEDDDEEAA